MGQSLAIPRVIPNDWKRLDLIVNKIKMRLGRDGTPTFTEITLSNTGLHLLDTDASHDLIIAPGSDLTADRTLTLTTGDSDRIITLSGNPTLDDWFDQSVKVAASPEFAGLTLTAFTGVLSAAAGVITGGAGHEELANLDFASAGHTGFQAQGDVLDDLNVTGVNTFTGDPVNDFLVGTAAGTLVWQYGATARTSMGLGTGDSPTFAGLHINSAEVTSTTLLTLESDINNNNEYNEILFKIVGGQNYGAIRSCVGAIGGDSYMSFFTTTDSGTLVRQVTIQHNGKVGLGTYNPETLLTIVSAAPYLTLHNVTEEDTDGGGESRIIGKREDGAGTPTAAGQIEISHDGSGVNDQLGKYVVSVNTGAGLVQALEIGSDLLATFAGAITASNYTAANLLTACATNAGALDFSAASKTLTVEDNAVVSQDYSSDASPQFTGIELGHVSDTTITRVSAGVIAVEGVTVMMVGGAPTAHSIASHDDTTGTGAELNTLTDGSDAGALHSHAAAYQPLDDVLTDLAALTAVADNEFIVGTGAGTYGHESGATARTSIGLGTTDTPQFAKLGINVAASASGLLKVYDVAINTTATYLGFYNYHQKIAGVTDYSDDFYGIYNVAGYNQSGGVLGDGYGISNTFLLTNGDVGDVSNVRFVAAIYNLTDLDGGKVYGDVFGFEFLIDQEVANEVTGNIYGNYIDIDADGTVGGSVYGLYLNEGSNIDYGIYQNGTAVNYFGGNIIINSIATPSESQFEITANGLGNIAFLNYAADNCGIFFDAHYDSGMKSDDAGSNFGIRKLVDELKIIYDSAVAVGGAITWNDGFVMASDGGIFMPNIKSGTDQANAGATANELYHDTDDNTIKIGV